MGNEKGLTPQAEDFSAWYNEIVQQAELASHSAVRGCMVIRPYGYRIWELIQAGLDGMFKATGHQNAYFPLFLPKSALDREAEHVEGFAPETAIVTHAGNSELEEPLVVRPTSEAIIWPIVRDWIDSYRDLPLLLNQWANVVRWELRTRPFLRTTEFLWQEGHTAHATESEAEEETRRMLGVYRTFMEDWMALPVITGLKTESEKFAGAVRTYATEGLMRDNRALQAGTSHNLGQNFARAFDVRFQTEEGEHDFVWSTSWGVSTRLIGGLIMAHGDDTGLVLPPRLAPYQAVIVPIWRNEDQKGQVLESAARLAEALVGGGIRTHLDGREGMNPGAKYYDWERRGVPVRLEIGPRDLEAGQAMVVRRFTPDGEDRKRPLSLGGITEELETLLVRMQGELLAEATERRGANTTRNVESMDTFRDVVESVGGFVFTGWCGDEGCEARVKEETKATIRVIPDEEFRSSDPPTRCLCGEASVAEVVRAKAY
ncbi:MAG: proline--tRNA ligase [marine benthic group bacterium]|jgi:prolyl-tRNA synthetase|nr:proline--tRNA ligase [Gemmatimonadota bacterium]MCL7963000.1 proline--tRNA ligase [Candidatus Carthagonibacter metallireducens]MCL7938587.1 proline--tRNA ligase [Gemmatimonadota bacterium]MCL7957553.1 proline--tRNA ligase [Gemmatimonadota bacterium]MCL7977390.1 proline--tRNA ligase [Gemmatimonadota bacterium]